MNPFDYGTLEYELEDAKQSIDKAIELSSKFRMEMGTVQEVEKIISSNAFYGDLKSYWKSSWNTFDPNNVDHVKKVVENARAVLEETKKNIEILHEKNLSNIESNKKLRETIINFMELVGIKRGYSTWAYKTNRSARKTETKHQAGYLADIERDIPVSDGYDLQISSCKRFAETIDKYEAEFIKRAVETKKQKEKEDAYIRKVAMAMELAKKYEIQDYKDNDTLIALVNDAAKSEWRDQNFPDGTEMDISCCQECSSWTVGEHRCSCGNRRMYLDIDGNFFDGYFANAMAD